MTMMRRFRRIADNVESSLGHERRELSYQFGKDSTADFDSPVTLARSDGRLGLAGTSFHAELARLVLKEVSF